MISANDIQQLIERGAGSNPILSVYLDMSVNSDNKRTWSIFLSKQKSRFPELESDRENHHREPLGEAIARVENWLEHEYDTTCRGVAIFAEIGGSGFDAFQFPVAVANRFEVLPHPIVGPLAEVVHTHPRYGVIVVDREHLRLLSVHMGTAGDEETLAPSAIPTAHDVQAGGYAQKDYQKRKAEETKQFFKDFADTIVRYHQKHGTEHWVLLGTTENTQHFTEFLPDSIADRVIHTGHAPPAASAAEIAKHLRPVLDDVARRHEAEAIDQVQDRVRESHFATSGFHDTLVQLQEGKVERLVVARDLEKDGVQCTQCGFILVRRDGECPYCGGALRDGIDLVESMIRIAASQAVEVDFVAGDTLDELKGVAALLKY